MFMCLYNYLCGYMSVFVWVYHRVGLLSACTYKIQRNQFHKIALYVKHMDSLCWYSVIHDPHAYKVI